MSSELISFLIIVGISIVSATASSSLIAKYFESRMFNNGICKRCGGTLKYFDTDSQGGRGYFCVECGNTIWVSYSVDKEYFKGGR